MSKLVVDASVAIKWLVAEPLTDEALAIVGCDADLIGPDLLPIEVGNALWKKVRATDLTADEAVARFEALGTLGLRIIPSGAIQRQAMQLAIATGRTVYDSLYLALSIAEDCKLVTADERFANALRDTAYASRVAWLGASAR